MPVTAKWYGKTFMAAFNEEIDFEVDTIKVSLHTNAYTPSQLHDYQDDLTNELGAGSGYSTGGATLGAPDMAYDSGTGIFNLDGADVSWAGATFTCKYAVVYDAQSGVAATNPLICHIH